MKTSWLLILVLQIQFFPDLRLHLICFVQIEFSIFLWSQLYDFKMACAKLPFTFILLFFKFFFHLTVEVNYFRTHASNLDICAWSESSEIPLNVSIVQKNVFLPSFFIPPLSFLSVHTLFSVSVWTEVCLTYMKPSSNDPQWDQSALRKHSEGVFGLLSLAMIHKAFSIINEPRLALGLSTGSRILTDIMLEWN